MKFGKDRRPFWPTKHKDRGAKNLPLTQTGSLCKTRTVVWRVSQSPGKNDPSGPLKSQPYKDKPCPPFGNYKNVLDERGRRYVNQSRDEKLLDSGGIRRLNTWQRNQPFHVMTCSSVTKHNNHIDVAGIFTRHTISPPQAYYYFICIRRSYATRGD